MKLIHDHGFAARRVILVTLLGAGVLTGALRGAAAESFPADQVDNQTLAAGDSLEFVLATLREVFAGIQSTYYEEVPAGLLLEAAIEGVREHLDPHTKLLSEDEYQALRSPQGGDVGIGVTLAFDHDVPHVMSILADSPAGTAGLKPGDRILAVDGHPLAGLSSQEVRPILQGSDGTSALLEVESPGGRPCSVPVTRAVVGRPPLETLLIAGDRVGYVRIRRFARGVAAKLADVLGGWAVRDLDGLLIDLRGNPGGYFDEAVDAADLFLPEGTEIVAASGRLPEENGRWIARWPAVDRGLPRVVLVDSLSASSAEILAGALQGSPKTVLLGQATYGKRSVQRVRPLAVGGALKVTCSHFSPPAGGRERRAKIVPEILLSDPDLAAPWGEIARRGLLARFVAEETFPANAAHLPRWNESPRAATGRWDEVAAHAPGFDQWCRALREHLAMWCDADLPAGADIGLESLRETWFADWAKERWGLGPGRAIQLELDPWVQQAVRVLMTARHARSDDSPSRPS